MGMTSRFSAHLAIAALVGAAAPAFAQSAKLPADDQAAIDAAITAVESDPCVRQAASSFAALNNGGPLTSANDPRLSGPLSSIAQCMGMSLDQDEMNMMRQTLFESVKAGQLAAPQSTRSIENPQFSSKTIYATQPTAAKDEVDALLEECKKVTEENAEKALDNPGPSGMRKRLAAVKDTFKDCPEKAINKVVDQIDKFGEDDLAARYPGVDRAEAARLQRAQNRYQRSSKGLIEMASEPTPPEKTLTERVKEGAVQGAQATGKAISRGLEATKEGLRTVGNRVSNALTPAPKADEDDFRYDETPPAEEESAPAAKKYPGSKLIDFVTKPVEKLEEAMDKADDPERK